MGDSAEKATSKLGGQTGAEGGYIKVSGCWPLPGRLALERREVPDSLVIYLFFTTRNVTVNNSYLNHISKGMTWMKVTINMIACPVDIH